jgi:alpha-ketoglutarate-dependent 2,4-dichlorophenoxyacetate dioxygenase
MEATLGAELSNVRLSDLDDETWGEVEDAFNEHGVLVIHDQFLSLDEQMAFGLRFGEFARYDDRSSVKSPGRETPQGDPVITVVGNVDKDGKHITDPNDPYIRNGGGNEGWHSDSSFQRLGAKVSILAGIEVTKEGGETEFADMRAAYDALPPETTERLSKLRAWHSIRYSRTALGANDLELPEDPTTLPGAEHSMVRHHPATGRPSLVLGSHVCHIFGMETAEAQRLAHDLMEEACQPPRVYSHTWREGDVVLWDNRCVLHRARPYDLSERRQLQHVRIVGDVEF